MDLLAVGFGVSLLAISAIVTYRWGIKPDREAKRQREHRALAQTRRLQGQNSQRRRAGLQ
ncbi:MAG: hypothetical protein QOD33_1965 [Pyrinomonadaceae bacterium]|nr:hypothetical protein [Pyrinomonadaceae bacterium]